MNKLVNKRNYGIDLLRIISMLYVVILHTLGQGGILASAQPKSMQFYTSWFFEIWAMCAVNIFAIISGYVGYRDKEKKHNYTTYIITWLQVVFYGVIVLLVYKLIMPDVIGLNDLKDMFFPVSKNLYWYFTAYTALFFVMPLLNAGIRASSDKVLKQLFLSIIVLFSIFDNIFNVFGTSAGYSFIWILLLYYIGAIIKKCNISERLNKRICILGIILLSLISWAWAMFGIDINAKAFIIAKNNIYAYTSPTIVCIAILYVIAFSKIKFSTYLEKIIAFFAPGAFAVYILNNHRCIWNYLMAGRFAYLGNQSTIKMLGVTLIFSFVFVIMSLLIDRVRILIFKLLHIKEIIEFIIKKLSCFLVKMKLIEE